MAGSVCAIGAYACDVFEDPDQPGRFIETCLFPSLLELRYRAARETKADDAIEEGLRPFLKRPPQTSYFVALKRERRAHQGAIDEDRLEIPQGQRP